MRTTTRAAVALLLGFAVAPLGCGGGTGTVSGKVTYNGQPLPSGTVIFTNADGKGNKTADIQPDGTYKIEGMPVGPAKVAVVTSPVSTAEAGGVCGRGGAPKMPTPPPDKLPPGVDPSQLPGSHQPGDVKKGVKIPDTYADAEKSGLTHTVTKGAQEWDIPLK